MPGSSQVEQNSLADFVITAQAGDTVSASVGAGSAFAPIAVGLNNSVPFVPSTLLYSGGQDTTLSFSFTMNVGGQATLTVPVPKSAATPAAIAIDATAACNPGFQATAQAEIVGATAPLPAAGHLWLQSRDVVLRTAALPPSAEATVRDAVSVQTDPYAVVTLVATLAAKAPTSLGSSQDGGSAHYPGQPVVIIDGAADANGAAVLTVPITSEFLTPGAGAALPSSRRAACW
jgi:hypothetical protein